MEVKKSKTAPKVAGRRKSKLLSEEDSVALAA